MRVVPIRDFFLRPQNYAHCRSLVVRRFGELTCKVWNARNFKGQVSPHEFLQAVVAASSKRFLVDSQGDPVELISWLLHELHRELGGTKKFGTSIIDRSLQGELMVTTMKDTKGPDGATTTTETTEKCAEAPDEGSRALCLHLVCHARYTTTSLAACMRCAGSRGTHAHGVEKRPASAIHLRIHPFRTALPTPTPTPLFSPPFPKPQPRMPFYMLGLDLPPPPLFQDVMEKNIIPQVPLAQILTKFDGESVHDTIRTVRGYAQTRGIAE